MCADAGGGPRLWTAQRQRKPKLEVPSALHSGVLCRRYAGYKQVSVSCKASLIVHDRRPSETNAFIRELMTAAKLDSHRIVACSDDRPLRSCKLRQPRKIHW